MSEKPVAYLNTYSDGSTNITRENITFKLANPSKPLYLKEQIQPKVKLTQAEFDEFIILRRAHNYSIKRFLIVISNEHNNFPLLRKRYLLGVEKQLELSLLWVNYTLGNKEETIEIVPEKKWFVRSKEQYEPDMDQGIAEGGYLYLAQGNIYSIEYYDVTTFKDEARQFDTKEEAEKWVTPSTEDVQLPVENE